LRAKNRPRFGCSIASTLDILDDRWSLVIIRDMVKGEGQVQRLSAIDGAYSDKSSDRATAASGDVRTD